MSAIEVKKDKDLKRLERLLAILNQLDSGELLNTKDLAEDYSVSLRTIQRDLEHLQRAGFDLCEHDRGEYAFSPGYSLKRISLNDEEVSLLTFMDSLIRSMGLPFEAAFKSLYAKCLSDDYDSSFYAKLPQSVKSKDSYSFIAELDIAIDECINVKVNYSSTNKMRQVSPLKIVYFEGFWYLLAKDNERQKIITFRLDNINSISRTAEHFILSDDVEAILNESVNVWFSGVRDIEVIVKVSAVVAQYFKMRDYFPLQKILKEDDDGSLLLSTKVSDYREILTIIYSWLPNLTVEKPADLQDLIKKQIIDYSESINSTQTLIV